ncbi:MULTISPECIES: hypothetical protein [Bacillus]|uniref:hypothetical protein n=1 Tax=Bacillus TaxID=1386 RepID=UPI0021001C0A|nr:MULTISPECIES: hypothetical protein [Bacillus]MDR4913778.1 hypothetical protein [Bacillus pseudomycoides]
MYLVEDDVEEEKLFHFHKKPNFTCPMGANIQIILAHTQEVMDQVLENMAMEQLFTSLVNTINFSYKVYIFLRHL